MKNMIAIPATVALAVFLGVAMLTMVDWDAPPVESTQTGYRGTGMIEINDAGDVAAEAAANQAPGVPYPLSGAETPLAKDVYENVQVLGHLPDEQFIRLMVAITEWVSPDEGCNYCHNPANMASDEIYTKTVARRMLQMTWEINENWTDHVAATGVTCYTCHRGAAIPANIWFENPGPEGAAGFAADRAGQNIAATNVGLTSLPTDPFSPFLEDSQNIRVHTEQALPTSNPPAHIKDTEWTYSLMVHMSEGLGVSCTYCHNTRAFNAWNESQPQRVTAWHGIQMVRQLNNEYLTSLQGVFPENRLGPQGDVAKTNCATCHNGVNKPLLGAPMAADYPSLQAAPN